MEIRIDPANKVFVGIEWDNNKLGFTLVRGHVHQKHVECLLPGVVLGVGESSS